MKPSRPEENEYAPFYARYIALVPGDDVMTALEAQRHGNGSYQPTRTDQNRIGQP